MRVGGPADLFAEVRNLFELRAIARFARSREIALFILGRGSDLVISDAGIRGLVVLNRAQQFRVEGTRFTADSGLPMAQGGDGHARGRASRASSSAWRSRARSAARSGPTRELTTRMWPDV